MDTTKSLDRRMTDSGQCSRNDTNTDQKKTSCTISVTQTILILVYSSVLLHGWDQVKVWIWMASHKCVSEPLLLHSEIFESWNHAVALKVPTMLLFNTHSSICLLAVNLVKDFTAVHSTKQVASNKLRCAHPTSSPAPSQRSSRAHDLTSDRHFTGFKLFFSNRFHQLLTPIHTSRHTSAHAPSRHFLRQFTLLRQFKDSYTQLFLFSCSHIGFCWNQFTTYWRRLHTYCPLPPARREDWS